MIVGYYCGSAGLSNVTGPCDAGYYCTLGATRSDPQNDATGGTCPAGHYCPQGTGVPQGCPPGYFTNATGNVDFSGCKLCTEGMASIYTVEGVYYNWGDGNNQKMIINVVIIILLRFCLLASLFLWSSIDHDSTCRNLFWYLVGYYCETTGLSAPTGECSMGYYCPAGQNVSNPTAYICTPGHYCPAGSPSEVSCPSGLYQNEAGQVRNLREPCDVYSYHQCRKIDINVQYQFLRTWEIFLIFMIVQQITTRENIFM